MFSRSSNSHLMDLTPDLTLPDAFEIVDKEMSEKKYDSLTYNYKIPHSLRPCTLTCCNIYNIIQMYFLLI